MRRYDARGSVLVWILVIAAVVGALAYFMYSKRGKESGIKTPDQIYNDIKGNVEKLRQQKAEESKQWQF
jgi:hypothetical protein